MLLSEGALQLASRLSPPVHGLLMPPWERASPTRPDSILEAGGNPYHPDADADGYRNAIAATTADAVVLGDSHAYGAGVQREEAWPALLGAYNMALPGHGPLQSLLLIDDALSKHPRSVVVSVYFGNDFYDSYRLSRMHPELIAGLDSTLLDAVATLERQSRPEDEMVELFPVERPADEPGTLRPWVSSHVKLYGLARAIRARLRPVPPPAALSRNFATATAALTPAQRLLVSPLDAGDWRTLLTPAYRMQVMDVSDPRIRLGFEATVAALRTIQARCRAAGAALLVVLLPTKESVFAPRAPSDVLLANLAAIEQRLRETLMARLATDRVDVLDTTPLLQAAPEQPYFEDIDGHPNASGHRLIAQAVAARVRQ